MRADRMDRLAAAALWAMALLVAAVFLLIVGDLVVRGAGQLSWSFLTRPPEDAGRSGGILPVLVSTGLVLLTCIAFAVPVALGCALYLAEHARGEGPFARLARASLDVLAGVPSIVFGLFGNAFFGQVLGLGYSILAGGLTLSCMVLPLLIRTTEEGLRAVPHAQRTAAFALGLSRTTTTFRVILPQALPALGAGLVLAIGRALAETAALLFTSGYGDRMPGSLLDPGRVLSVHIYDLAMNVAGGDERAYASALVLVIALFGIQWLARRAVHGARASEGGAL